MLKYSIVPLCIVAVCALGMVIDWQSKPAVDHATDTKALRRVCASGRIEGATPEVELRPQVRGRVRQVFAREGDVVEAGALLLQLDDDQYCHAIALANAELAIAGAELDFIREGAHPKERAQAEALYRAKLAQFDRADLTWKRIQNLSATRAVAEQEADDQRGLTLGLKSEVDAARFHWERLLAGPRQDEIRVAEAKVAAAAARRNLAEVELRHTSLSAPFRARVLRAEVEVGELVGPECATAPIVLADTSVLRVRAFVEELEAPQVRLGMPAAITADGLPNTTIEGRVTQISPRMSPKELWSDQPGERLDTKIREVWLSLDHPPSDLPLGLRVDVTIYPLVSIAPEKAEVSLDR